MALAAYLAIQQIESSNLLEPLVMEKAASIHPSAVILAVTTLGSKFRFLGAILAVRVAVVVMIFTREIRFERLEEVNERVKEKEEGERS